MGKPMRQELTHIAPAERITLRQWREGLAMRQSDLADMVGCSRSEIAHIESGRRRPRPDLLDRIYTVVPELEVMV